MDAEKLQCAPGASTFDRVCPSLPIVFFKQFVLQKNFFLRTINGRNRRSVDLLKKGLQCTAQ